jgi:predicted DNA-binding antitoxin AbrB/MazE fold protein
MYENSIMKPIKIVKIKEGRVWRRRDKMVIERVNLIQEHCM